MTKTSTQAKAEKPSAANSLPSRARTRAREEGQTLTDEEVAAASAAYQIRFRRYDRLAPFARNAQLHDAEQVAAIARSIEEFGFVGAIAADEQGIVAGHGRTLAAEKIYKAGGRIKAPNGAPIPDKTVPWVDCSGWSDVQRRAYIIADNQLVRRAGQDFDLLRLEMTELQGMGLDLDLLGFEAGALNTILNPDGGEDDAAAPDGDGDAALDEPEKPTIIECPKCAHQFSVLAERKDEKSKRRKAA